MLTVMPRAATALARPVGQDAADLLEAVLADSGAVAARAVARLELDVTTLVAVARRVDRGPGCVGPDAQTGTGGRSRPSRKPVGGATGISGPSICCSACCA
jgi:hypothetical protein